MTDSNSPYLIPTESVQSEELIKKSRFITYLAHTPSVEEAKQFISLIKDKHSDARHNCWAFVAGRPNDSMKWGFSDDGEPSGTAGKPILAQLSGSGVGEITAVVTRYSGGVKLGTGGLVKAYGGGVQNTLKLLQTIEKKVTTCLQLRLDYSLMPLTQSIIDLFSATTLSSEFAEQVVIHVEIEKADELEFKQTIINKSGAKVLVNGFEDN